MKVSRRHRIIGFIIVGGIIATNAQASRDSDEAAIRNLYKQEKQAFETKDLRPVEALETSDYTSKQPDGHLFNRQQGDEIRKQSLANLEHIHFDLTVVSVTVTKAKAMAIVQMKMSALLKAPKPGAHRLDATSKARSQWIKTAQGWRVRHSDNFETTILVDGKPYPPPTPSR